MTLPTHAMDLSEDDLFNNDVFIEESQKYIK